MERMEKLLLFATVMSFLNMFNVAAEDFKVRALHLDLRTQVMTPEALKKTAGQAAEQGMNTLIVEWEATFPFKENAILKNRYAYTEDEVKDFIDYCGTLHLDVIPLQNCFGHCEYILCHDKYAAIREDTRDFSQVCPLEIERDKEVFRSIFKEVASLHKSKYFHIGADETRLLGKCMKCADFIDLHGRSRLLGQYINEMCRLVKEMGKIPVIWADMLLQYPENIDLLPADVVVVDWNYGWNPSHFGNIDKLLSSGLEVWGATALRSAPDNIYQTSWDKHFMNLSEFIPFAREHGYEGMVQTSWSTSGRYGYIWDCTGDVIDLQPVRQVYPMNAFNILVSAFGKAVTCTESFELSRFVRDYCRSTFGFTEPECQIMVEYFSTAQNSVRCTVTDSSENIRKELKKCQGLKKALSTLKPRKNHAEFKHFCMMMDIREHYLRVKLVEDQMQTDKQLDEHKMSYLKQLVSLEREGKKLRKDFIAVHKSFLKDPSLCLGEWSYLKKIVNMKAKLKR